MGPGEQQGNILGRVIANGQFAAEDVKWRESLLEHEAALVQIGQPGGGVGDYSRLLGK